MSKKVLVFSSSPRRGGNSDILCDQFISGAQQSGHAAEKIFLKDKKINYCTGCGVCAIYKKPCTQKDDMSEIIDKIISANVIVMATPVYFYTMCGQIKTLIDRCCARYTEITDKEFYFIVTAADENTNAMERTIEGFRGFLSCLSGSKEKGIIYGTGAYLVGDIKKNSAMTEALEAGKHI